MARMNIITRMINWISGRYVKTVNHESIFGSGNIAGGGSGSLDPGDGIRIQDGIVSAKVDNTTIGFDTNGNLKTLGESGVTKQYVDNQDQALQDQIDLKQDEITDSIDTHDITDEDYLSNLVDTSNKRRSVLKLWNYILSKMAGAISTAIESNFIAGRALVTNANGKLIESQVSAVELSYVKDVTSSIQDQLDDKVNKITGMTARTNNRIYQGKLDDQGRFVSIENELNWSHNYTTTAENQLFTRQGANNMYTTYLKSTNGTLTKGTGITNDYTHYIKCGNIYQISIGFQNSAEIANGALLYTLPDTISGNSIEMFIVISNVNGDTRILQCGGAIPGNQIKSKSAIPAGYWFGSAIFIKV